MHRLFSILKKFQFNILFAVLGLCVGGFIAYRADMLVFLGSLWFVGFTFILGFTSLVISQFYKEKLFSSIGFKCLLLVVFYLCGSIIFTNVVQAQKQSRAEDLVETIEEYNNANGRYPSTLDPEYLNKFIFISDSIGSTFNLGYDLNGWIYCSYYSASKDWSCGD